MDISTAITILDHLDLAGVTQMLPYPCDLRVNAARRTQCISSSIGFARCSMDPVHNDIQYFCFVFLTKTGDEQKLTQ